MIGGIYKNRGRGAPFRVRFKGIHKRFWSEREAERFLNGLRFQDDNGTFDPRDWQRDQPLGFEYLSRKWLEIKGSEVKSIKAMENHMGYAWSYFGNRNIKEIDYPELEDFFRSPALKHLSGKTRWNIRTTLHAFWVWVVKRNRKTKVPVAMPEFPEIPFKLKFRKTVSLAVQDEILEDIKAHAPYRAWLACYILSTYPKIRPAELRSVREKDIDLDLGIIRIRSPKSPDRSDSKEVKLLDEDVALLRALPMGFPESYLCRHDDSGHGRFRGQRWGVNYLRLKVWEPACRRLGVDGVSLYPGTKHSTVRGLRAHLRPDEIRQGTGIVSNKAFERYFQHEFEDEIKVYRKRAALRSGPHVARLSDHTKATK